jgi:S1-C subfamily serine protease
MTDHPDPIAEFSNASVARAKAAEGAIVAIRLARGRHLTGMVWRDGTIVTSEQSLPNQDGFEIATNGKPGQTAELAGRDPGTNIAVLRPAAPIAPPSVTAAEPQTGALVLAIGATRAGEASARLGMVNLAGPEWHSSRGGLINRRIALDLRLARSEEGVPVFDAAGACLGMSTFGPRGQVIAIPTATIERVVPQLLKEGRMTRGWLGVALQAVAVPDALRETADQSSGLMVMSVAAGGPAAQAGILAGDIVLSFDGTSTQRWRKMARQFGPDSIGRKAELRLIRSGAVSSVFATIGERPADA